MDYQWIADEQALEAFLQPVKPGDLIYLDTEFVRERTYFARLGLLQISDGERFALVDVPALQSAAAVVQMMREQVLVMHACSEDLEALHAWCGHWPETFYDTQIAAALCGHDMQCSYQKLVSTLCDVELPKDATRTDWLQRPLSAQQLEYAVMDVVYLPQIYQLLQARLQTLDRLSWWQEECQRLLATVSRETGSEDLWRQVKGAGNLQGAALARLVVLAAWRDARARERDLPKGFILRDDKLIQLASQAPDSLHDLQSLALHPSLIRRDGKVLLELLKAGSEQPPPDSLPGPPDASAKALFKKARKQVGEYANKLDVAPELLMRRRWLETLIRGDSPPDALLGWRRDKVLEPLKSLLEESHE